MSNPNESLLEEEKRDGSSMLPALQKLLQLAYSDDTDRQLQAVMGISKLIERRPVSAASFGPLCHTLSRLAASEQSAVVAYAVRGIKMLVLDDALRPQVAVAGIPSVLTAALREWEDNAPCLREVLGAIQTLCCDKTTVLAVVNAGAIGSVLELLDAQDLELRILANAISANVLSFSDSLLLTNEACINDYSDSMEDLLDAARGGDCFVRDFALAAVANACAHPVLAARANQLGALHLLRRILHHSQRRSSFSTRNTLGIRGQLAKTAIARLTASGTADIEQGRAGGGEGAEVAGGKLQFYTFKWGVYPSLRVSYVMTAKHRILIVLWAVVVFFILRPVLGSMI